MKRGWYGSGYMTQGCLIVAMQVMNDGEPKSYPTSY